ncbi:DUF1834 family protein [Leeia sp. TBRC 13508]|uniref:DUF1834 family protein n=1 Tax=Leeia speluncae TaxID=2884804 RepID=A0ABS8D2A1_9NEIS|nr:phage protein Gp37 [Leeia speluncae]MCB6182315.1 DUF1834 family protein [Leeia speluncae]
MSVIAQIEDAMINRLRTTLQATGYKVDVDSYAGQLEDDRGVRRLPAVWLYFEGGGEPKPVGTSRQKWLIPLTWSILIATQNLRGEREARTGLVAGTRNELGSYQLQSDVRRSLINQDFGLPIDQMRPGKTKALSVGKQDGGISVYSLQCHTKYVEIMPEAAANASDPDWLRTGLNYFLQPDDGKVDASDLVTLNP